MKKYQVNVDLRIKEMAESIDYHKGEEVVGQPHKVYNRLITQEDVIADLKGNCIGDLPIAIQIGCVTREGALKIIEEFNRLTSANWTLDSSNNFVLESSSHGEVMR